MPRRSASARSGRCGESGLTLIAVALFHRDVYVAGCSRQDSPTDATDLPWRRVLFANRVTDTESYRTPDRGCIKLFSRK